MNGIARIASRLFAGDPIHVLAAVLLDLAVVAAAYAAAMLLRFEGNVPADSVDIALWAVPVIALGFVAANIGFGVYRTVWAYGGIGDILTLFRPIVLMTVVAFMVGALPDQRHLPLSVMLIAGALIFPAMAMVKMRTRLIARIPWSTAASRRLLIIGAGRGGQLLARELHDHPDLNYQPVGFIDAEEGAAHRRIQGLRVFGGLSEIEETIRNRGVEVVAIALPRASGGDVREIVAVCQRLSVPVRIVPSVDALMDGSHSRDHLRDITLDDLLGREPVEVDFAACSASVHGRSVLVTGAAGSIGSELCRQVLTFEPRELHLLDNNESGLHDLSLELAEISPDTVLKLWVGNITDEQRVDAIFDASRPDLVYHSAALKHVPLMEEHPGEAFRVNIVGTMNVVRAARLYETGTFVLISTDKSVEPSNVYGATKRISELLVQAHADATKATEFVTVRFGNVMGSRGSAPEIFMRQAERGGPVTVTHPDMLRYYISIPEAVALVIQAGSFGGGGDIFMLDMGEEINMLELAERTIRLRGLRPGDDIEVLITGPRPGEKLSEELVADYEDAQPTDHPKIMRLLSTVEVGEAELIRLIEETRAFMWDDLEELRRRVHLIARRYAGEPPGRAPKADSHQDSVSR
jgi:FlaA1/EpsC-like NDP-sugar epimerase